MGRVAGLMACLVLALAAPIAHAQVQPRIVGGSTTTISQYPWQAAIAYDPAKVAGNPFQRQFCGGSLVTTHIVLTAGHCVHRTDPDNNSDLDPDDVNVILGQTTLSTAPPSSEFDVQGVSKQSGYDDRFGPGGGVPSNDVAYIVLASPYNAATPIDIAGPDEGALWDPGSNEQITGWGATAESGPGSAGSDTLRHATVPIVTDSSCASTYGGNFNVSTMICAGFPAGGIDTCYGDSGGPMQGAIGGGAYRLVGITSWGAGCAQPNAFGVYTRVAQSSLRDAVATTVFNLEDTFGLPHEDIVGGDDTDPPETTITSGPSGPTNDDTPTFTFSSNEVGSTFECRFDSALFGSCLGPSGSHTPTTALGDGQHTFEVQATDPSANTDPTPASRSFTVDTAPPSDPTVSSSSHAINVPSNDPTVDVTFSGASDPLSGVDGFSYQWSTSPTTVPDTTKDAEETATGTTSPTLADGSHYFHLRTRDNAGNWTATVHLGPFVIDATVPGAPQITDTDPDSPSSQGVLKVKGTAEAGSTVRLYKAPTVSDCIAANLVDTGSAAEFQSPGLDASVSANTTTRFRATATNGVGSVSGCSAGFDYVADSTAPSDPTLSSTSHTVNVPSNDPTVDVTFSGASDALSGVDGFSFEWSTSPTTLPDTTKDAEETATGTTSPTLADGSSHYFHLRTRDNAGNWTSTVHLGPFAIDTSSTPAPPLSTPVAGLFQDRTPPTGTVAGRSKRGGAIKLRLGCDEDCTAKAAGVVIVRRVRFKLRGARVEIPAAGSAIVKLKAKGRKARRAVRKRLSSGARGRAKIRVGFADRAGNAVSEKLIVKLTR